MLPDDRDRLRHMRDAASAALKFTEGRSRQDIDTDIQLQFALTRAIEIVGEAASQISIETRGSLPNLPWAKMISIRNRLIHAYFNIDHDILWNTATVSIPELIARLADVELK